MQILSDQKAHDELSLYTLSRPDPQGIHPDRSGFLADSHVIFSKNSISERRINAQNNMEVFHA